MTDLEVSTGRGSTRRALRWPLVVGLNLAGGLVSLPGVFVVLVWLVQEGIVAGIPDHDPDFADAVPVIAQIAIVLITVGFVSGNLWVRSVAPRWRAWMWVVALASASLPGVVLFAL